jgi:hypothetical protein
MSPPRRPRPRSVVETILMQSIRERIAAQKTPAGKFEVIQDAIDRGILPTYLLQELLYGENAS